MQRQGSILYWLIPCNFPDMFKFSYLTLILFSTSLMANESIKTLPDPTRRDVVVAEPIKPLKEVKKRKKNRPKKQIPPQFVLQQTLISEVRKTAVVNGKTISIGDQINGAKVLQVNSDNVVLLLKGIPRSVYLTSRIDIKETRR